MSIFKKKWLLQLLGLIAASIIIWFVGPIIAIGGSVPLEGMIARLVLIVILFAIWGLILLLAKLKARKNEQKLIEELGESSPDEAADQSAEELQVIKDRFEEAISVLKKTNKGGVLSGNQYIYELPWYVVIGPPGSGKTTALINSGLNFPLSDKFGKDAIRGVGGTRNCDWWFTDDAILIDTAGRYTTQDSHKDTDSGAWGGFLDLLKKHRKRRPINGILVAVSITELMLSNQAQIEQHANAIKSRIEELNTQLGIRAPIYMMFSKCDLIAGFNEFFESLSHEERNQVWGITFPVIDEKAEKNANDLLPGEFDELLQRINEQLLQHMHQERDSSKRATLFAFPQELASLKAPVTDFLEQIFHPNRFQGAPLLRGVYFSSGTQEGTPIDRLMGNLASSFGLDRTSQPAFSGQGRSYFIHNLFNQVMFPESSMVGSDPKAEARRAWFQRGTYFTAFTALLVGGFIWATSFTQNKSAIADVESHISHYENKLTELPFITTQIDTLLPALNDLRAASDVYQEEVPWSLGSGLYQGDKLDPAVHNAYHRVLEGRFLYSIGAQLEEFLSTTSETELLFEGLKTYLMLGRIQHLNPDEVKLFMSLIWSATVPEKQEQLLAHLDSLLSEKFSPLPLNQQTIELTRMSLTDMPFAEYIYHQIQMTAADQSQDILLTRVLGRHGDRVFTYNQGDLKNARIPALFTYNGYHEVYSKSSEQIIEHNLKQQWVLSDEVSDEEIDDQRLLDVTTEVEELYFEDYITQWRRLLNNLSIVQAKNLSHAVDILEAASSPSSPVKKLLTTVEKNTYLTKKDQAASKAAGVAEGLGEAAATLSTSADMQKARLERMMQAAGKVNSGDGTQAPVYQVESAFKEINELVQEVDGNPPLIDELVGDFYNSFNFLSEMQSSGTALDAAKQSASGEGRNPLKLLQQKAKQLPNPVNKWILALSSQGWNMVVGGTRSELSSMLGQEILPLCQKGIEGRFPFSTNMSKEVTLLDFTRFFGPGQLMDQFFNENIKPFADTRRSPWRWRAANGHPMGISNSVLRKFETIAKIRSTFFPSGGSQPQIGFSLKPVFMDTGSQRFVLDINGQTVSYRHGPARVSNLQWPSKKDTTGQSSATFVDADGKSSTKVESGIWGWFKLLKSAELQRGGQADKFMVVFEQQGHRVEMELRANSVNNPFMMRELEAFRCPRL
ncbi:type VI secretion system membrane subunit TssM [Vibrio sp. JC009]|uniref:type VI secretion system membrane subunit TssM n=1 Tax=Vibrio sp. JC009 TaxID=2912314 RepID=UPI0023AE7015|nr:type VI secretion system membrane subunit TssM [Vibrio sp. JC009]WED22938.1 type VI secretion system membrane subunit TssM [Vibrio sp. JC009]